MICPNCGTDNKTEFKFCVKCGSNLENPGEINIEQVAMSGFRSEEDYASEKNSFKISSGTFTISDRAPEVSSSLFTADELNDTDEDFDFSSYDEPYIPKLDTDRVTVPTGNNMNNNNPAPEAFPHQPMMQQPGMAGQMGAASNGFVNPQPVVQPQNVMGVNPYMNQVYGGQPVYGAQQMMTPQIIGYDANGMPIYSQPQPVMYAPPQIIGYDANGMPVYGQPQPMMYAPPQFVGYDQNGMPVYSQPQPVMYGAVPENVQPVIYGNVTEAPQQPYQSAMPQLGTPNGQQYSGVMPSANMSGQPLNGQPAVAPPPVQQPAKMQEEPVQDMDDTVKVSDEFWDNFFSDSKGRDSDGDDGQDDFFGRSRHGNSGDMAGVGSERIDVSRLKKHERRKNTYMNDTPEVNADDLPKNVRSEFTKRIMSQTAVVNADDLETNVRKKKHDIMGATADVNAEELEVFERKKSKITMNQADVADPDELEAYEHEHVESIMEQADHAVEALPKKKSAYKDEVDEIELPAYMQAKKTVKVEEKKIPDIQGFK